MMIWKPDDYKIVPEKVQTSIVGFIEKTLFPEILTWIGPGCLKMHFGIQFRHVSLRQFCLSLSSLESSSSFVKDNSEYLLKLIVVSDLLATTFLKIYGKDLTGAAIHIIKLLTTLLGFAFIEAPTELEARRVLVIVCIMLSKF